MSNYIKFSKLTIHQKITVRGHLQQICSKLPQNYRTTLYHIDFINFGLQGYFGAPGVPFWRYGH